MSNNDIFALIRQEQDGLDTETFVDLYKVPFYLLSDSNSVAVLDYFKGIAADYLCTEEGKKELKSNNGNFNWNDFSNIPDAFLAKYGISQLPYPTSLCDTVDANENLVNSEIPIIYQVMESNQIMKNGKYMPDWEDLISRSADEDERLYLEDVRAGMYSYLLEGNDDFAGFTFNMVYVVKMKCGHYEIFQCPYNTFYSIKESLFHARQHAKKSNCTDCISGFSYNRKSMKANA